MRHRLLIAAALALALLLLLSVRRAASWEEKDLLRLARAAVEAEVRGTTLPRIEDRSQPHPVFVTIERNGRVRGCRGALAARSRSLEEEVVLAARAAAAHDPRCSPLKREELAGFRVTVTIVERHEPLDQIETLLPSEGLVLTSGGRTGVVLPWEGKAPKVRLQWAYRKAGVSPGAPCALSRLIAERFRG